MVSAHRQAWTWQDEWYGLTMTDIRRLEAETAKALAVKMGRSETELVLPPSEASQAVGENHKAITDTSSSNHLTSQTNENVSFIIFLVVLIAVCQWVLGRTLTYHTPSTGSIPICVKSVVLVRLSWLIDMERGFWHHNRWTGSPTALE